MAVYTDVDFDDLAALLDGYDIGEPRSFKGIAEGVENSNFVLETSRGRFILTLYEKRVRKDDLPFFLGLLEHLATRGLPCAVPVRNRSGHSWTTVNGKPAAVLTWLDGLSLRQPDPAHCAAAGSALAALHHTGTGFPLRRANSLGMQSWGLLAKEVVSRADDIQDGLAGLIAGSLAHIEHNWPTELPEGIIHADLFPDNVLFMDEQVSGLIDFYFACNGPYAYDLAIMLNAWCFEPDGSYNIAKGKRLIGGYRSGRELAARELSAVPVLAAGAALRFLLTRLIDWLQPDPSALVRPKDPREYARRVEFHLSVKDASEYGI